MPALPSPIQTRVLEAAKRAQAENPAGWTVSAVRRLDGEHRQACPMGHQTAWTAVMNLVEKGDLITLPLSDGWRFLLRKQRRRKWTNETRRESRGLNRRSRPAEPAAPRLW